MRDDELWKYCTEATSCSNCGVGRSSVICFWRAHRSHSQVRRLNLRTTFHCSYFNFNLDTRIGNARAIHRRRRPQTADVFLQHRPAFFEIRKGSALKIKR
jgi:hypothetical protein